MDGRILPRPEFGIDRDGGGRILARNLQNHESVSESVKEAAGRGVVEIAARQTTGAHRRTGVRGTAAQTPRLQRHSRRH